jgi:hypothetical protein
MKGSRDLKKKFHFKKKTKIITGRILGVVFLAIIIYIFLPNTNYNNDNSINSSHNEDTSISNDSNKIAKLYFYNNETNCDLSGEIYFGNNLIGSTINGSFLLSKANYDKFWTGEIN